MALLKGLVDIESPAGGEKEACGFLEEQMLDLGLDASIDGIGNVVGTAGTGKTTLLLLGHIDTYPGRIPVRVEGRHLWGRGSVDAKGPLAAFTVAASRFVDDARLKVIVIGAVGEEGDSRGAHFAAPRYAPTAIIIGEPSGVSGITIGYKGSTKIRYRLRQAEAHTGLGERSPAEQAVAFWEAILSKYPKNGARAGFNDVTPTLKEFRTARDGLDAGVEMLIDVRTPPGFDRVAFESHVSSSRDAATIEYAEAVDAVLSGKSNPLVSAMISSMRANGIAPTFLKKTGTADMNILSKAHPGVPIIAYGPGDSSLDHTPLERLDLEEYLAAIRVLSGALDAFADRASR